MKIKLVQSGGFLPVTKEAVTDADWTEEDSEELLKHIAINDGASSPIRDGIDYTLEIGGREVMVNLEKASGKYATVLNKLKKDLKVVKT